MALHRDNRHQDGLLERTEGKLQGSNETSTDPRLALAANMQHVEALPKPNGPQPTITKAEKRLRARSMRARYVRQQCPDMKDIPALLSIKQKKRLIQRYEQEKRAIGLSRELPDGTSGASQSAKPKKLEATKGKKKGPALVKANLPTSSGMVSNNVSESNITPIFTAKQAPPPAPKVHKRAPRGPRKKQHGTSQNPNVVSQPSNKMAPLSDARRAEVLRNLKGLTHNDPINVD